MEKLPTLRPLTGAASICEQAQRLQARLAARYGDEFALEVKLCLSQIGSGSLPVDRLPSAASDLYPARRARGSRLRRWRPAAGACRTVIGREFMMAVYGWICAVLEDESRFMEMMLK